MAHTVKLVQGSQSLDLHSGDYTTLLSGVTLSSPPPRQVWHTPDHGEQRLVRSEDDDRECVVRVEIQAADEDTLQNDIVAIRRYLNEAVRHELAGDNDAVYLQLQQDGATNAVNHRIKSGYVDDSASHYGSGARDLSAPIALDIFLYMTLAPYGEWTSTISLANLLPSSPHFIEWSTAITSPAYADGWGAVGSPTTAIFDTTNYLVGSVSQKIVTDASTTEGILSDNVTASASTAYVAYAWIYIESGGDDVRIQLQDDVGTIDTVDITAAGGNSDKSVVDAAGNTWYRGSVSGTSDGSATTIHMRVQRLSASASTATTFYVDACYIGQASTVPDAWMSAYAIENRCDTTTDESNINYIDVWGIPGDAPPFIDLEMNWDTTGAQYLLIGKALTLPNHDLFYVWRNRSTDVRLNEGMFCTEPEDLSQGDGTTNGSWADQADAGRHNGNYARFTASGGTGSGDLRYSNTAGTNGTVQDFAAYAYRVFALARSSSTSSTITLTAPLFPSTVSGQARSVQTIDTWELIDLGLLDARSLYDDFVTAAGGAIYVDFDVAAVPDTKTFDLDAVFFMPVSNGFCVFDTNSSGQSPQATIWGSKGKSNTNNPAGGAIAVLGDRAFYTGSPGSITEHYTLLNQLTDGTHDLTDTTTVNFTITPRTRHLLGT